MNFSVECLGASGEVGRSAFLVQTDKSIMVDYGVKLFDKSGKPRFPEKSEVDPELAVISHAHLDHSGCLPMLYKNNKIRWYATPPTKDICEVLWSDSMKIMAEESPYGGAEYKKALKYWSPMLYRKTMHTGDTRITLHDAGHIAGAAMIEIEHSDRKLLYTGDFKGEGTYMHKGARTIGDVDYLIIESTYANREHPDRRQSEKELMAEIRETLAKGGNVLLPSFALGRTQELISLIRSHDRNIPVFVDGMGREITKRYIMHPRYIRDVHEFRAHVRSVSIVASPADRRMVTSRPSVIISSAGMLSGGPALGYLFNMNSRSKVIFTGYCVEETNGWKLLNHGYITKDEQDLHVDLPVGYIDLSAHAGRTDLLKFIEKADPEKIICVHGDRTEEFANELRVDFGYDAVAPRTGELIELA